MKFKCIEQFYVDKVDDDGFSMDEAMLVKEGSIYEVGEVAYNVIAGNNALHLTNENGWIEITKETLNAHFEQI